LKWLVAAAIFLALACLAFYPVSPVSGSHLLSCACEDSVDQSWFVAWTSHAISSHINPLTSTYLNYPQGINILANVSMMALGALMTPVALTLGPVAAFNLAMRLAFAASGFSMFAVLRWWRISWLAALVGGLVYGFSPYMIGQGTGHLHLAFVAIPPLFVFAAERGLTGRWKPRRSGLTLAGLAVVQFFIAIEVVTSLMVILVIALLGGFLVLGRDARQYARRVVSMLLWMGVPATVLLAPPALYALAGPESYKGPVQPVAVLSVLRADLFSVVIPTNLQRLGLASWKTVGSAFVGANGSENGEYLGLPYLVGLIAIIAWQWKDRRVRVGAFVLAAAFLLTLGASLEVGGHATVIRLPFDLIAHLPLLQDEIPIRYSLYLQLFSALILSVGLDRAWKRLHASPGPSRRRWLLGDRVLGKAALGAGLILILAPLVPVVPYTSAATDVSSYFTSAQVLALPPGSVALAYPYPEFPADVAMLWQAESGWRFRLLGGYAYRRGPDAAATLVPAMLAPALVQEVWSDAYSGSGLRGLPAGTSIAQAAVALRDFIGLNHVGVILVGFEGRDPGTIVRVVDRALHRDGQRYGNLEVWKVPSGP
jgi:hypothetical protein